MVEQGHYHGSEDGTRALEVRSWLIDGDFSKAEQVARRIEDRYDSYLVERLAVASATGNARSESELVHRLTAKNVSVP